MDSETEKRLRGVNIRLDAKHALETSGIGNDRRLIFRGDAGECCIALLLQICRKVDFAEFQCGIVQEELVEWPTLGARNKCCGGGTGGKRSGGIGTSHASVNYAREHFLWAGRACGVHISRHADLVDKVDPVLIAQFGEIGQRLVSTAGETFKQGLHEWRVGLSEGPDLDRKSTRLN